MHLKRVKKNKSLVVLIFMMGCFSCEKEELPIQPHNPGDVVVNQVGIGQDYKNQLFFDLETNTIVSSNEKNIWDLGFESADDGFHVVLNTAKGMRVYDTLTSFANVTSIPVVQWSWDAHSGNWDSTAIGSWPSEDKLYVIDRGYDHLGAHQGYYKLDILAFDENSFQIEYGELNEVNATSCTINKSSLHTLTYFSFETGTIVVAPEDKDWDLVFTQYTHLFTDPLSSYVVTGVLLNRYNTRGARVEGVNFEDISLENIMSLDLTTDLNVIGYDWKVYDYDAQSYVVNSGISYIIETSDGFFYKMRFIDFYSETGKKGFPKFEYQQL